MDKRKSKRRKGDDVPIIGDYSAAQDARLRANPRTREPPTLQDPRQTDSRGRDNRWVLDPRDVLRHARLARQRERTGPVAKVVRYSPIAIAVVVGFLVYWNFDTLREVRVDFSRLSSLFEDDAAGDKSTPGQPDTEAVEAPVFVEAGPVIDDADTPAPPEREIAVPSDDAPAPPTQTAARPEARAEQSASNEDASEQNAPEQTALADTAQRSEQRAQAEPDARAPPREEVRSSPVSPPAPPPAPETFHFGGPVTTVSERDAAAAVLILRNGGQRGESSITWWTSGGSATPGVDYADLGRITERFARGAQNVTIRIPIVGDGVVEPPESFYVHLATSEAAGGSSELARAEVVIDDDE
jgi:hypothetical protein